MQRLFVNAVNCVLLILIFIAVPEISHKQFWHWQISSTPLAEKLTFGGLILAVAANVSAATLFLKDAKARDACAKWSFVFGGIIFLEYACARGWVSFDWLKNFLLWVQRRF